MFLIQQQQQKLNWCSTLARPVRAWIGLLTIEIERKPIAHQHGERGISRRGWRARYTQTKSLPPYLKRAYGFEVGHSRVTVRYQTYFSLCCQSFCPAVKLAFSSSLFCVMFEKY